MDLGAVRDTIAASARIAVLTGAGISKESGIPTFRDADGLWREHRAEELASAEGFAADPLLVWQWYEMRRTVIEMAEPNPAHYALVRLQDRTPAFTLVTQNVDGLHERAGSRDVQRLHGSIWITRCLQCGGEAEDRRVPFPELPPRCGCGGMLRPAVVWFGEALPSEVWDNAEQAARNADLLLVVGTSSVVYPAASLVPIAARAGAKIVEINPGKTPFSATVDFSIRGPAGEILPQLIE
jgi:NAD-dependent deacetylase